MFPENQRTLHTNQTGSHDNTSVRADWTPRETLAPRAHFTVHTHTFHTHTHTKRDPDPILFLLDPLRTQPRLPLPEYPRPPRKMAASKERRQGRGRRNSVNPYARKRNQEEN